MATTIALVQQMGLLLPFISIVAACLLAIGGLFADREKWSSLGALH